MKEGLLADLKKTRQKENSDNEICEKLYQDCIKFIKSVNNLNITECIYTIPSFSLGYPTYDIEKVVKFIKARLLKENLQVNVLNSNEIFIKWG